MQSMGNFFKFFGNSPEVLSTDKQPLVMFLCIVSELFLFWIWFPPILQNIYCRICYLHCLIAVLLKIQYSCPLSSGHVHFHSSDSDSAEVVCSLGMGIWKINLQMALRWVDCAIEKHSLTIFCLMHVKG